MASALRGLLDDVLIACHGIHMFVACNDSILGSVLDVIISVFLM